MKVYWQKFLEWMLDHLPEESHELKEEQPQTSMDRYFLSIAQTPREQEVNISPLGGQTP